MTTQKQQQDAGLDKASTEDAAKAKREEEKMQLLDELAILNTRKDAIEDLIEDRGTRLRALMSDDGDTRRMNASGEAQFYEQRVFAVADAAKLAEVAIKGSKKGGPITVETLVEGFRPTAAFVDGAADAKVSIEGLVTVGFDQRFKFTRPQTKDAKLKRGQITEQTKAEAEAALAEVSRRMQERRKVAK